MAAPGPTGPGTEQANAGSIAGWNPTAAPDGSWNDAVKTNNDPCPPGYRVPSSAQWQNVISNNARTSIGSWAWNHTNYSAGIQLGSLLFLPTAGYRDNGEGWLGQRGQFSYYWSSTGNAVLFSSNGNSEVTSRDKQFGFSIRCIAE